MDPGGDVRVAITLKPGGELLIGEIAIADGGPQPFTGWLELMSALERAIHTGEAPR